jgi:AraC-like DNA-binding protein
MFENRKPDELIQDNSFRAIEICHGGNGCTAVQRISNKRFLHGEAPSIPLPECDAADCSCELIDFEDRRACADRRAVRCPFVANVISFSVNESAFVYYRRLAKLRIFVDLHYEEHLPLEVAANVVGLERTYFSRFFRDKTGVTYCRWVGFVRLQKAIGLMIARNLSVTDIAFRVGFRDLRTFERTCALLTGLTPKDMKLRVIEDFQTLENS